MEIFNGILIPFLGTTLGAACVFFMKHSLSDSVQRALTGFAAGVMVAASVLEPADSGNGAVCRHGQIFLSSGGAWILGRHFVLAAVG